MALPTFAQQFGPQTLGGNFYQEHPEAAYTQALGLGYGQAPRTRYLRGLFPEIQQSFLGVLPLRGPEFSFLDYLQEQQPTVEAAWRGLSPQERGENPGLFQSKVRFL